MGRVVIREAEQRFKTKKGQGKFDTHLIDRGGNHFINGKCVNPKTNELKKCSDDVWRHKEVGDTHPAEGTEIYPITIKTN